ncbi:fmil-1 [Pristionchus pacificus]|nr:fmil-1 [Pristionchus pacificus]
MRIIYSTVIISLLIVAASADYTDEFRIHEGASIGTILTASPELKRKLDRVSNCYGSLESSIQWIELKDNTNVLQTTESLNYVNLNTREQLQGLLTMLCPGNKVISLPFSVHITKMNRHSPTFKKDSLEINVPLGSPVGALLTQLEVTDHDAVIYNSQRTLSFKDTKSIGDSLFSIQNDGSINLKASIPASEAYKKIHMQVVAVDYGSPQRYKEANITIVPVTVSQVRSLRVNVASDKYQIFEWEAPEYGIPDKYRLVIRRGEHTLADEEVDAKANRAMTRVKIGKDWDVTYSVSAVSFYGETSSPQEPFKIIHGKLECVGDCTHGGLPLCFYGPLNTLQQYEDSEGRHCDCFPGYTGISCEKRESCASEKRVDTYGGLDWPETGVNASARLLCPYNDKSEEIWRPCEWNSLEGRAQWGKTKGHERCQTQTSILMHLGMHSTFAEKADQISSINTVSSYLAKLLNVPSFATSGPAHFDLKIAQHMTMVLDAVTRVNYTRIHERTKANVTEAKLHLLNRINTLSSRLPVPFQLASDREEKNNISFNVIHWLPATENFRQQVGESCYVQLPMIDDENVMRAVCMSNSSLVSTIDARNPLMIMNVDMPEHLVFSKITIGLKTFNNSENYTCVYYDEIERGWSNRGIRRISQRGGFVECETSHLSMFSILPESAFSSSSSMLRDLAVLLPTVTSFISIVCGVFLLFLSAIQRGPSIDYPLLVFLFLAFIIHALHLLTLLAPQLGDPFLQAPTLHLVYQFCVISVCALIMLLAQSIYSFIVQFKCNDDKPEPPLCSSFCSTLFFGIIIPGLLTSTTYFIAQQNRHELTRVITRLDWLFILNFLSPSLLFFALTIVFCLSSLKAASNCSSRASSSLSLTPASLYASTLLLLNILLLAHIILFVFRGYGDGLVAALFVVCQLAYCLVSFIFAGYLYRVRYLQMNGDELSTRTIETKSRAVLSHVDRRPEEPDCSALLQSPHNRSDDMSCSSFGVNGCKGNGNNTSSYYQSHSSSHNNQVIVRSLKSTPSPPPLMLDSPNGFSMTASLFERAPMVSIV